MSTFKRHQDLDGLSNDEHPQYVLADGTRAFTGTVSGIAGTLSTHLVTKGQLDAVIAGLDWQNSVLDKDNVLASSARGLFLQQDSPADGLHVQHNGNGNGIAIEHSSTGSSFLISDTGATTQDVMVAECAH